MIIPIGLFSALIIGSGALGLSGLFKGEIPFSSSKTITGIPARVIGALCLGLCAALCAGAYAVIVPGFKR